MKAQREPVTGRRVWHGRTRQGTDVHVLPMPGFVKTYASATTRYGSIDTHLPDGTLLPVGIAHFLEHKMFQTEKGDVFDLYAARGASANAYTTFEHTTYLFSCSNRFEANFDTLLDTMSSIATDPAGVAREKGIIGQEIAMYDDDPSWQGYFGLLRALYRDHPLHIDIAGTSATIAPIDPPLLQRTHAAYYHPANMVVVVAGDVDPEEVLARTDARLVADHPGRRLARRTVPEPRAVAAREVRKRLPVERPHVLLGWKDADPGAGRERVRRQVETALVLELLFADGGRVQAPLYSEGIVDDTFGADAEVGDGYAFALISAEVDDVAAYRRRLERALTAAVRAPVTPDETERARRKALGLYARVFNSPEGAAGWLLNVALDDQSVGADVRALHDVAPADLTRRMRALVSAPRAWSLLLPR